MAAMRDPAMELTSAANDGYVSSAASCSATSTGRFVPGADIQRSRRRPFEGPLSSSIAGVRSPPYGSCDSIVGAHQLNEVHHPMENRLPRKLAAILYADVAGYSRLTGEDEEGTHRALRDNLDAISAAIEDHQGRVVHYAGDAILADFGTVTEALTSAIAIQRELARRNRALPEERRMEFRMGVNLGEIIVDRDDIYGDGVNVAARLEGLSDPGGICISESVHLAVGNKLPLEYEDIGEQRVKNIAKPIRAYKVVFEADSKVKPSEQPTRQVLDKPSIAVLPFNNMSSEPGQEYFADGIAEDLITALCRIRQFFVIARNSSFSYKGQSPDVRRVAAELGARYVVEGSVRKSGERVRISAQLVDGATGNHLWAERYDRSSVDVFAVQDEITETIVASLEPELGRIERTIARRNPPASLDAWGHYQRGLALMHEVNADSLLQAEETFARTIELDPEFAGPHSALAYTKMHRAMFLPTTDYPTLAGEALKIARRGIVLDPRDALAFCALGRAHVQLKEHGPALDALRTAVSLNPSSAICHHRLGFALVHSGQPDAGIPHFEQALKLSPRDPERWSFFNGFACAHLMRGRYGEAADSAARSTALPNANIFPWVHLASALGHLQREGDAQACLKEVLARYPDFTTEYYVERASLVAHPDLVHNCAEGLKKIGPDSVAS